MVEESFWGHFDCLVSQSRIIIEAPRGTPVDHVSLLEYPVDYGYLEDTSSMDGDGIDVFLGSDPLKRVNAILCTRARLAAPRRRTKKLDSSTKPIRRYVAS